MSFNDASELLQRLIGLRFLAPPYARDVWPYTDVGHKTHHVAEKAANVYCVPPGFSRRSWVVVGVFRVPDHVEFPTLACISHTAWNGDVSETLGNW